MFKVWFVYVLFILLYFLISRAIEIITPTTELSGEYKCLVSTFDKEDSRSKKMVVYGE